MELITSNSAETRTCTQCFGDFPVTAEFFYMDKAALKAECKQCTRTRAQKTKKNRRARHWAKPTRKCRSCQQEFDNTEEFFPPSKPRADGGTWLRHNCRLCVGELLRDNWSDIPEVLWEQRNQIAHRCRSYGITITQYVELYRKQAGVCAICQKPEVIIDSRRSVVRLLAIDHDHTTGRVRGLLCFNCNTAIGKLGDSRAALLRVVEYLQGIITGEEHNG